MKHCMIWLKLSQVILSVHFILVTLSINYQIIVYCSYLVDF
jgi:hypothetical protein